jgi:hypothetical protein
MSRITRAFALAGLFVFALADLSSAQTSYPFIFSLYPCGLQRGTSADITLDGQYNYHSSYKVIIEGQGVTGEVIVPKDGWPAADAKTKAIPVLNQIKLKITAAADAPLGVREVRVVTPRGVSSAGQIVIGDEPEILEKEPNNDAAQAQEITAPVTINGRIQQAEDVDTFKFKVQAGEELTFAVICARLEDRIHDLQEHADPMLSLRDSTGRELAANDDYYRADPLLHYKFDKAGEYNVQVRDVRYMGNPYWTYRLVVTKRPFITSVVPMAVRPGTSTDVKSSGFNLDQSGNCKLEVAANAPMGEQLVQIKTSRGISNPIPIVVTDLPESTPSSTPSAESPAPLAIPSAMNSWLAKSGDVHRYRFHAAKGQMITFEIEARRIDSLIDSVLTLRDAKGNEIKSNDDADGPDSRIEWTCSADGDYLIDVQDLHRRGGDDFTYILSARPSGPDFRLRCDDDKMKLGPGNSSAWYILVERKFGFNGIIQVEVKGLPPGVTAASLTIAANCQHGCLILTAASDAKVGVGEVEVIGTATVNGPDGKPVTISHKAIPLSEIYTPGGGRGHYPMHTQAVAVTSETDIWLELSTTSVTLAPGGTAKIDVNVKRAPGYTKPVTLDVYLRHLGSVYGNPLPPGVSLDEGASKTLLGDNETKGSIVLKAAPDAAPVTNLPIAVLGAVSINFVVKVSYSGPPVLLTVSPKK